MRKIYASEVCKQCGKVMEWERFPRKSVHLDKCHSCRDEPGEPEMTPEINRTMIKSLASSLDRFEERLRKLEENQPYEQCEATIPSWGRWVQCEKPAGHTGLHYCTMYKRSSIEWDDGKVKEPDL